MPANEVEIKFRVRDLEALAEKLEAAEQDAQSAQRKSRSNGAVHAGARGEPPESTRQAIAQGLGRLLERSFK